MQHTSCTEDRIQHALDRCLDGFRSSESLSQSWKTGWCMNRWSLEELLKRDPENFLILLQQIVKRARQVQEECEYELVAPLTIMFESTLIQTPYCPIECDLLVEACEVFHGFLTWPEPYSSVSHSVLTTIQQELRAPGISYHRLVKEEQGISAEHQRGNTITVLLLNPADVPQAFLSVVQQLSTIEVSQREISINLIKHAIQSSLGTKSHTHTLHRTLQSLSDDVLSHTLLCVSAILETAAAMADSSAARAHVLQGLEEVQEKLNLPACNGATSDGTLQFLKLPTAKCYTIHWDTDNFDSLCEFLETEPELSSIFSDGHTEEDELDEEDADEEEEDEEVETDRYEMEDCLDPRASMFSTASSLSTASKDSMLSTSSDFSPVSTLSSSSQASGTDSDFCEDVEEEPHLLTHSGKNKNAAGLSKRLSRLFKARGHSLCRAKSLGNTDSKEKKELLPVTRSKRSNSMPQQVLTLTVDPAWSDCATVTSLCYRKRPILSSNEDEDPSAALVRVMVFGADQVAGKLARAYNSLRQREKLSPRLTKHCRMKMYFIPVKREMTTHTHTGLISASPIKNTQEVNTEVHGNSTNNIAHLLGMLDPWYERNTLCLLDLPLHLVCQQTSKSDSECVEESVKECLPIMADLLLYYCRNAARPALIQLYQAELTLAGGEMRTEVFIHSLELGHMAATRAIKAMGAASKRFGIDGDREAVPLSLEVIYNQVVISGRSQKTRAEKVCTSVNLSKVCGIQEELNPNLEVLYLTMTEVLKRQNSKTKRNYNQQLSVSRVKVDRFRVYASGNTTFAVCLDQDEKKILQSVTRCEVSVCYKPDSCSDWLKVRALSSQMEQTFCSLLCLPICTFSGPQP